MRILSIPLRCMQPHHGALSRAFMLGQSAQSVSKQFHQLRREASRAICCYTMLPQNRHTLVLMGHNLTRHRELSPDFASPLQEQPYRIVLLYPLFAKGSPSSAAPLARARNGAVMISCVAFARPVKFAPCGSALRCCGGLQLRPPALCLTRRAIRLAFVRVRSGFAALTNVLAVPSPPATRTKSS